MNWKKRGRAILQKKGNMVYEGGLPELIEEATSSNELLFFFLENNGIKVEKPFSYNLDDLIFIEKTYRNLIKKNVDEYTLERLVTLFFGQTLIALYGGKWKTYSGNFHTLTPFVVELGTVNKAIDIFIICKNLSSKSGMQGAREGKVLYYRAKEAEKNALL